MDKRIPLYSDLGGLIDLLNAESTGLAEKNAGLGTTPSKAWTVLAIPFVFMKNFLFKSGYLNHADRFYTSFYYTLLRFVTSLKTLKLQNKL